MRATVRLADGHEERVELVEEIGIGRQVGLEPAASVFVSRARPDQPMPRQDAPRVRVGDEHRPARRVEQDRVGRLGPDTRDREQLGAQRLERHRPHPAEASVHAPENPTRQRPQASGLDARRSGRSNQPRQAAEIHGGQAAGRQQPARAERGNGAGGIDPRGVLGQDRADSDLVRRAAGPPALGPELSPKRRVEPQQPRLGPVTGRTGRAPAPPWS